MEHELNDDNFSMIFILTVIFDVVCSLDLVIRTNALKVVVSAFSSFSDCSIKRLDR